jgi:hypothetical protein
MTSFRAVTYRALLRELATASRLARQGRDQQSFRHLERAHILGQASTVQHVRVHWKMLLWGCRRKDAREIFGQIQRIIGAAIATPLGMLPRGNTGGANASPFRSMPIPQDLEKLMP